MPVENNSASDIKKPTFWVSQMFIVVATVLGVFLAASQGFKQAVQFDKIRDDKSNYYLRKSLQNELAENVVYIREFIKKVEDKIDKPMLVLETFVWNSMNYSPATLETPSELLGEAKKFYRRASEIMATPHFNNVQRAKLLGELAVHIEKNVLFKFDQNTEQIKKELQGLAITL